MDITLIVPYLSAAALLISIGTALNSFVGSGAKQNAATLADHGVRIQALESEIDHLPNREMVHTLQLTLKDIQIEMASIKVATEQSSRTSRRVEDYLMNRGDGGRS